jgi:ribosomal protein L3 glutamine methyltransferase
MDRGDGAALAEEFLTVGDLLRFCATLFEREEIFCGHGTDDRWDEAVALVVGHLRLPWDRAGLLLDARLPLAERVELIDLARQRVETRVPAPYLTGFAWFAGHRFHVDPRVVIPRSPMAELVEACFQPWLVPEAPQRILDLCTGSGCIGIACAHAFPEAEVDLVDASPDALDVARRNVEEHGLGHRVNVLRSNLFGDLPARRYELIVCNPPYVPDAEIEEMPREYRHEPRVGLAGGADGLDIAMRVLAGARSYLQDEGLLALEVGEGAERLEARCPSLSFIWPTFERGGRGIALIGAGDLPAPADSL